MCSLSRWLLIHIFIIFIHWSIYCHLNAQMLQTLFFPLIKNKSHHELQLSCVYSYAWFGCEHYLLTAAVDRIWTSDLRHRNQAFYQCLNFTVIIIHNWNFYKLFSSDFLLSKKSFVNFMFVREKTMGSNLIEGTEISDLPICGHYKN